MNLDHSTFEVKPYPFKKEIDVPSSKSYANRLLVLAAIKKEDVLIKNIPLSSDVLTMIECLKRIGLKVEIEKSNIKVCGSFPACEKERGCELETGDGGTTNRFLIPLLCRGRNEYIINPEGHMRERPMEPLVNSLKDLGCAVTYNENGHWIKVKGPYLKKKETKIDCSSSTQFLTGVALSTVDLDVKIIPENLEVSLPYWELTQNLLDKFKENELDFENPVDFSSLTYPLALAAVTGSVLVKNAKKRDPYQADSVFIEVLKSMGAKIEYKNEGLYCEKKILKAIDFDGSQCPDAIPTLLYVCSFAEGTSRIFNLEVLTHKECDRFTEMIRILNAFGVKIEVDYQKYEIKVLGGTSTVEKIEITPEKDHRMVMVSYLFLRTLEGGTLNNSHHVKKSFSNFFEVMEN